MNQPHPYCTSCGAPLSSAFCTSCGARATLEPSPDQTIESLFAPDTRTMVRSWPAQQPAPLLTPRPDSGPESQQTPHGAADAGAAGPTAPRPAGQGMKILVRAVVAFVLLVALGVGSVFAFGWWRDRPVSQALDAADEAVASVLDPLSRAEGLDDVGAAGAAAPKAVAAVEKAIEGIEDEEGDLAARSRNVMTDQVTLLTALAPLESLSADSLTVWGTALPEVQQAQSSVLASQRALEKIDSGFAEKVADPRTATTHAIEVVAGAADASLTASFQELLADLESVDQTSGAAALGERAELAEAAAGAAATGLQGGAEERLSSLQAAFGAISSLSAMDPESLHLWGNAKTVLSDATTDLDIDGAAALDSMSAWVSKAQRKMDAWETEYERAENLRSSATADLDSYSAAVSKLMRQYNRERDATDDALQEAELDDYSAGYDVEYAMEEGVLARQKLLNRLESAWPPEGMGGAHDALVDVLDDAVEAMTVGEQAVEDWNGCYFDCPDSFRDTGGWQDFSSASAQISSQFDAARKGWDAALAAALRSANAVPLPPMPKV